MHSLLAARGDRIAHDPHGPLVLVGGYGTVGRELARLVDRHHPDIPLALAGRRPDAARDLAEEIGGTALRVDLRSEEPIVFSARAIVTLVNDPDDRILRACLASGTPFVDITRWTSRVGTATALASSAIARSPVVLASGWMGGLAPWLAGSLARGSGGGCEIDIGILYDLEDRAGEDAIEYMDRMGVPFEIVRDGARRSVEPLTDPRRLLEGGRAHTLVRIDTPEQWTLPLTLAVRSAETRIGFSSELATWGLRVLRALGFFRWTGGPTLQRLRRSLLRSTGSGGRALVQVRVGVPGARHAREVTIVDPRGQAHLTALGALRAIERALALDGSAAHAGVDFPELWPGDAVAWLRERGVEMRGGAAA